MKKLITNYQAEKLYYPPTHISMGRHLFENYCFSYNNHNEIPKNYVSIDLEMTGLDDDNDEIIQVGAVKYKNNKIVDCLTQTIKPKQLETIDPYIFNMTQLSKEILNVSPSIASVIDKLFNFIDGFIIVGHHVSTDLFFLLHVFNDFGLLDKTQKYLYIDTLYLSRQSLSQYKIYDYRLEFLKKVFKIHISSHNALDDAITSAIIMQKLLKNHNNHISFYKLNDIYPIFNKNNGVILL